jgi:glycosyltransferase involved in cell wall biosynthesis
MEAGAMDLPSIVTDINGSREIIINGENGVIIPSKDADALYSAMLRMATDTPTTKRMAASARQLIADRFEQSFVRQCLYDFYQEISKLLNHGSIA